MPPNPTIYCLQEVTDYSDFESLCHDLMALEGYPKIEPIGGFSDKGRDAVDIDHTGKSTIFAYSVREDWRAKLAEDAAKIRKHNHKCDEMVFLCTANFSATERDEAVKKISADYGWRLELYGLERLRILLDSRHPHIKSNHPAIFPPAFLRGIEGSLSASERHNLLILSAPEDYIFAGWLARKLTADGYSIWSEAIRSSDKIPYPEDINKAIKTETFRVITVHSKSFFQSTDAVGLRALALDVGKEAKIDFEIPVSIDPQEHITSSSGNNISPIQFGRSWAKGLGDLKETLVNLDCPRPRFDGRFVCSNYYDETEVLSENAETLYSNAFNIESIPPVVYRFEISPSFLEKEYEDRWAFRKVSEKLVFSFFSPPEDISQETSVRQTGEDSWPDVSEITWSEKGGNKKIYTRSLIPELIRKSLFIHCRTKGLKYCISSGLVYFPDGLVPRNRLPSYLDDGSKLAPLGIYGERKYYRPENKSTYYRYYLAPTFFVDPTLFVEPGSDTPSDLRSTVLYIRLRLRFTDTDNNVLPHRTALSRRKHLCVNWWNDDWFRRTLAVAQFLSEDGKIKIGTEDGGQIVISSIPNTFEISAGINEDALKTLGLDRGPGPMDYPDTVEDDDEANGSLEDE